MTRAGVDGCGVKDAEALVEVVGWDELAPPVVMGDLKRGCFEGSQGGVASTLFLQGLDRAFGAWVVVGGAGDVADVEWTGREAMVVVARSVCEREGGNWRR